MGRYDAFRVVKDLVHQHELQQIVSEKLDDSIRKLFPLS